MKWAGKEFLQVIPFVFTIIITWVFEGLYMSDVARMFEHPQECLLEFLEVFEVMIMFVEGFTSGVQGSVTKGYFQLFMTLITCRSGLGMS